MYVVIDDHMGNIDIEINTISHIKIWCHKVSLAANLQAGTGRKHTYDTTFYAGGDHSIVSLSGNTSVVLISAKFKMREKLSSWQFDLGRSAFHWQPHVLVPIYNVLDENYLVTNYCWFSMLIDHLFTTH